MANIRIKDLPADGAPKQTDLIPIDLGSTRHATVKAVVESGRPTASKAEAEAGVDPQKAMTPLTTKQAIDVQVGAGYVPKTVSVIASDGLTGGGALSGDVTVGMTSTNVDRLAKVDGIETGAQVNTVNSVNTKTGDVVLGASDVGAATSSQGAKADTALQAPGGTTGQILAKNSNTTNDVGWVSSEAATAVSYGPQTLTEPQKTQARTNIGAFATPTGTTAEYVRGDGTLATMDNSAVGLGNVANKSEAQMVASGAIADAIGGKSPADGKAADNSLLNGQTAAQLPLSSAMQAALDNQAAKAWINFDGFTAGYPIRGSFNVSSITRLAAGVFQINFITPMPSVNYACVASAAGDGNGDTRLASIPNDGRLIGSTRVVITSPASMNNLDSKNVSVVVFGD